MEEASLRCEAGSAWTKSLPRLRRSVGRRQDEAPEERRLLCLGRECDSFYDARKGIDPDSDELSLH